MVGVRNENILLRGNALADLPFVEDAFLLVEDGAIAAYGKMYELDVVVPHLPKNIMDVAGSFVLPTWCDSHTHLVFAKSREDEFIDKLMGKTYAEIAANGGGILNSAKVLANTNEDELFRLAMVRLKEAAALGTGAIEIKSGYGLTPAAELKMLRVINRL